MWPQVEAWATSFADNPGPGARLPTFATVSWDDAAAHMPSLDIPCMGATFAGHTVDIEAARTTLSASEHGTCLYNGFRPGTGTLMTEDDGVAPRAMAWTMHKKDVRRWFYWNSTYYDDFQGGNGPTDVFSEARTFGYKDGVDPVIGETGWNHSNGDGVLFYPGTDSAFPDQSYGVPGPFVSLRLKQLRRGLQDVDYLSLAASIDPAATQALIDATVPKVVWEVGVATLVDPSWVLTDVSWSVDPDDWDAARAALAAIIEGAP